MDDHVQCWVRHQHFYILRYLTDEDPFLTTSLSSSTNPLVAKQVDQLSVTPRGSEGNSRLGKKSPHTVENEGTTTITEEPRPTYPLFAQASMDTLN